MSAIQIQNLTHVYSKGTSFEKVAVDNISVEIEKGDFIGVIGHTGCGKSTLIKHLNGILKPTEGKVFIDGQDIFADKKTLKEIRFKVGIVFQYPEYQLFEENVFKDIAFGPINMGLSESEINDRVLKSIDFVGLDHSIMGKSPFELSGGEKRRVAIAGVISMMPKILILDEPAAGLDPEGRKKIFNKIKEYHLKTNSTVILISHSMDDVAEYVDKIMVINKSKLYMYDNVENVFSDADKLEKIGLDIPQISKVFLELKKKGIKIDTNILTIAQAKQFVVDFLRRKNL